MFAGFRGASGDIQLDANGDVITTTLTGLRAERFIVDDPSGAGAWTFSADEIAQARREAV